MGRNSLERFTNTGQTFLLIGALALGTALPGISVADSEEEEDDEVDPINLSISFDRTAARSFDDESDTKVTAQENEWEVAIEQGLAISKNLSAFYSLSALNNRDRKFESANFTSSNKIELNEAWLNWQPNTMEAVALTLGRMDLEDERHWWWDETFDAFTINYEGSFNSTLSLGVEAREISTDTPIHHPEDRDIFWILAESTFSTEMFGEYGLLLAHKEDQSSSYMPGTDVEEQNLDEFDDSVTWLGVRFGHDWDTGLLGSIGTSIDLGWVNGRRHSVVEEEEEEDDEEDEDMEFALTKERVTIAGIDSERINGWGLDSRLTWGPLGEMGPSLSIGAAMGSGNQSSDSAQSRRFIQTGLQATDGTEQNYGWLSEPELGNLTVFSVRATIPITSGHAIDLQHHQYQRTRLDDDFFDSEINLEPLPRVRNLGTELGVRWTAEFDSGLSTTATVSRFRAGDAFGESKGETADKVEIELGFEF